jgi:hypothetical protein
MSQPKQALPWKQPTDDLADQVEAMYEKAQHLIVCGFVNMKPLSEAQRRDVFAAVDLHHAVEVLAELHRAFDIAWTMTGDVRRVELVFLADARELWVDRVRKRLDQGHHLVSPRATAQLLREVIEYGSTEPGAPPVGKSTLVHMLMSVTSEQNMRPEFPGDVPTRRERRQQGTKVGGFDLDQTFTVAETIIPDTVATSLFNAPLKLELLKSNTHDIWFRPWPARTKSTGLGATPEECFKIATGVDLLDVIHLGNIIAKQSAMVQKIRFSRDELIDSGASEAAIGLLFERMALKLADFQSQLADERNAGPVAHQRYKLTQYPFLALDDDEFIMLRHTWAIDKLCGNHLFFVAAVGLMENQSNSVAARFKSAMNDVFEDVVGEILQRIAAKSGRISKVAQESEMQAAWTEKKGNTPSVCDWALFAGSHCIVVDATNHPVKAVLAQGLSTWEEYSTDIEKNFTNNKFEQLLSTITQLRERGGWDGESIDENTDFIPLVIVPDVGLPSDPLIEADLMRRSRPIFEHLQPHVSPPAVMQLSDLQLLEGIAAHSPRDILEVIRDWRHAAARSGIPLQMFVLSNGGQLPGSGHILRSSKALDRLLATR